jgi:hypothetical protein
VIVLLYGMGTFVSGRLLKFKPLVIGGVIAWLCGILSFGQPFDIQLLILMVAIVASYIVPGHLLASSKQTYV